MFSSFGNFPSGIKQKKKKKKERKKEKEKKLLSVKIKFNRIAKIFKHD